MAVFPSTSCKGFALDDPVGDVVDDICAMMLFEAAAKFVLVVDEAIVCCIRLFETLTPECWVLRILFGEERPMVFVVDPFNTEAGGLMLT